MRTRLPFILLLALAATACGPQSLDELGRKESALSDAGGVTVVQVNPYKGGRFERFGEEGAVTYGTAKRFARMLDERYRRTSVIGMQEITSAENAERLRQILEEETDHPWGVRHFHKATYAGALPATQEAVFWRTDVHEVIADFGTREVERFDTSAGPSSHSLRFGGLLLRRKGTTRDLAVFTGKLVPLHFKRNGRVLDNDDRAAEASRLMGWIDQKLAPYPHATRVIAVDANGDYGTKSWTRFRSKYWDASDDRATHWTYGARRIDFLWWDMDAGARRKDGFLVGPIVSPDFGSDHRAVVARVYVRSK